MKIAIIQELVRVRRGGAEMSALEMARHLAALDLEVTIICRGPPAAPFVDRGVTFLPIVPKGLTRAAQTWRFVRAAELLCRRSGFDVVHAITPCPAANVYQPRGGTYPETITRSLAPVRSPLLRGLKRVGRRLNLRQRLLMRLERRLLVKYRRHRLVAAVSDYVRRQVEVGFGFPSARIRVIFNGVDVAPLEQPERAALRTRAREALGLDERSPLVLFAAHNFRLKGLGELLRAQAAGGHDWTVVVAGRDAPRPYARLAARLGLAERVRFVGTREPLRKWYAAADVLAHPTWYDPCSRVVLEALCLGLPVVTTRYNGAAEVVEPGRHGEVIPEPADAVALAAALQRALRPELRAACQADAPRLCQQLSMRRHARELLTLYHDALTIH